MALTSAAKAQIIKNFKKSKNDTGSSAVQIALLTARINHLTEHLKTFKKDFHTRYGLMKLVNKRKKHMAYLLRTDLDSYKNVTQALGIRGISKEAEDRA